MITAHQNFASGCFLFKKRKKNRNENKKKKKEYNYKLHFRLSKHNIFIFQIFGLQSPPSAPTVAALLSFAWCQGER
jgi:hypothetical protein